MANIKSQIKRVRTNEESRARNASRKSEARTAIKKVETLAAEGKKDEATKALNEAISLLDRLAPDGILARNSADRKKAHLQGVVAAL